MAKKRANGEGNIRKRKDGRWEGRYTAGVDPETGKPIAKSVLARTQRECKEKLQKAMEELEKIDVTKRRDYTVGEWAQLWYENYAKPSVRASTAAYYKNYIDQHIVPRIGDIKLISLTTLQIQKFYNETKAHGRVQRYENMDDLSLSNKTIRGLHTMLRQCLEQAVMERLIPYNPANGCRLPKKEKKKMQIIPPEKIRDYLKAAEEWGVLPMFYLELSTGLRRGILVSVTGCVLWFFLHVFPFRWYGKPRQIRKHFCRALYSPNAKIVPPSRRRAIHSPGKTPAAWRAHRSVRSEMSLVG